MPAIWSSWHELIRLAVVGVIAYVSLLLLLRGFGKRSLAKMNAYDFITTIALGSALSSAIVSQDVTIDRAAAAFVLLLSLQRIVAVPSTRSPRLNGLLNNEPAILVRNGKLLHDAMKRERVTEADVEAAIRSAGHLEVSVVSAVILETDGSMSVIGTRSAAVANHQSGAS